MIPLTYIVSLQILKLMANDEQESESQELLNFLLNKQMVQRIRVAICKIARDCKKIIRRILTLQSVGISRMRPKIQIAKDQA